MTDATDKPDTSARRAVMVRLAEDELAALVLLASASDRSLAYTARALIRAGLGLTTAGTEDRNGG